MMAVLWFILGIVVFLIMVHPIVFWCVFLPLAVIFVIALIKFFKDGGIGLKHFVTALVILFILVVVLLILCMP